MKRSWLIALALLLVGVLVLLLLRFGSGARTTRTAYETAKRDVDTHNAVHTDAVDPHMHNASIGDYESARFFSSGLAQASSQFGKDSPEWNSYALRWAYSCARNAHKAGVLRSDKDTPKGTAQAASLFLQFCHDALPYSDLEKDGAYQKSTQAKFGRELVIVERQQGVEGAIDFATDYLRRSKDPYELRAALDYLQRIDMLEPPKSSWVGPERQAIEIYQMAKESFICGQSAGCTSGHPLTLEFCVQHGCNTLRSYEMLVADQLSPADRKLYQWYLSAFRVLIAKS